MTPCAQYKPPGELKLEQNIPDEDSRPAPVVRVRGIRNGVSIEGSGGSRLQRFR